MLVASFGVGVGAGVVLGDGAGVVSGDDVGVGVGVGIGDGVGEGVWFGAVQLTTIATRSTKQIQAMNSCDFLTFTPPLLASL